MNTSNPAIKRIREDVKELRRHPSNRYYAAPLEDDLFEWHFTIRGPNDTPFEHGVYHGRIILPVQYPFKPPNIVFLTKNGRFEAGAKICLSISAHHPEAWQPAWGIRTMLEALISFLPSPGSGAIGALEWTDEERRHLAEHSYDFVCSHCGAIESLVHEHMSTNDEDAQDSELVERIAQMEVGRPRGDSTLSQGSTPSSSPSTSGRKAATSGTGSPGASAITSPDGSPCQLTSFPAALSPQLAGVNVGQSEGAAAHGNSSPPPPPSPSPSSPSSSWTDASSSVPNSPLPQAPHGASRNVHLRGPVEGTQALRATPGTRDDGREGQRNNRQDRGTPWPWSMPGDDREDRVLAMIVNVAFGLVLVFVARKFAQCVVEVDLDSYIGEL